jgi:hypothetical protein
MSTASAVVDLQLMRQRGTCTQPYGFNAVRGGLGHAGQGLRRVLSGGCGVAGCRQTARQTPVRTAVDTTTRLSNESVPTRHRHTRWPPPEAPPYPLTSSCHRLNGAKQTARSRQTQCAHVRCKSLAKIAAGSRHSPCAVFNWGASILTDK